MFRRFARHVREGFIGIKRHLAMAISTASAVTITLVLVGVFAIIAGNLAFLSKEIEDSISLVALIDYSIEEKTQINAIQTTIEKIVGVDHVEYRTKEEEFDFYNTSYPDMIEFSELYREDNPFHNTFIVYMKDGNLINDIKNTVSKINGITSVEDGGSNTYTLISLLQSVRLFGGILVISLVVLAVYLIYNTINITISARQVEISIMRSVGARNGFLRAPFLVEGIIIGILGSIIPVALVVFGYSYIITHTGGNVFGVLTLLPNMPFILYLSAILVGIGVFVGFIGSYISVCKYLRLTR